MSTENDYLDDDHDDDANEGNAAKVLRKQNRELKAQFDELKASHDALTAKQRAADVQEFLEQHGAPKRLAKYASRDIEDVDSESVLGWLKENGSDFGWDNPDADEPDDERDARRISRASREAPESRRPDITPEFIRTASRQDLIAAGVLRAD